MTDKEIKEAFGKTKQIEVETKACQQCGKDMGFEWILGPVCGKCCRENHKRVAGR